MKTPNAPEVSLLQDFSLLCAQSLPILPVLFNVDVHFWFQILQPYPFFVLDQLQDPGQDPLPGDPLPGKGIWTS